MSVVQKILGFYERQKVLIVSGAIIVGSHWGWDKLQHTSLVDQEKRKPLPLFIVMQFYGWVKNAVAEMVGGEAKETENAAAASK